MAFIINGIQIKNPDGGFKIDRFNVTTIERLANADATGDLIAKKLKFFFTYTSLSAEDLDTILSAIWDTNKLFMPFTYDYQGSERTTTVYVGSIPSELWHAGKGSNWVWQNVTFNLIQK